jgi:rhodanese-related sulfurtransferase
MFSALFGRRDRTNGTAEIAHDELVALQREKRCVIVDVREPHEFEGGHIPGAINLPLSRFDAQEIPKGNRIVLVCQAGGRSAKALQRAMEAGVSDISHYAPGTGGWRARGGPLVRGG